MADAENIAGLALPEHPRPWRIQSVGVSSHVIDALGDTVTVFDEADPLWSGIVLIVNSQAALFESADLLGRAEEAHANCDECEGEGVPELCEKCFPLFDDARLKRRAALNLKEA